MTITQETAERAATLVWGELARRSFDTDVVSEYDRAQLLGAIAKCVIDADAGAFGTPEDDARDKHVDAVILAQVQCLAPDILDGALAYLQSDDGKRVDLIVPYDNARARDVAAVLASVPGVTARARRFPLGSVIEVSGSVDAVRYVRLPEEER